MTIPTLQVHRASAAIFIPGIILAAFATTLLVAGGARPSAVGVLALVYGGIVIVAAGLVLVTWTVGEEENASPKLAMAILLGSIATSLFLTGGCLLTGRSAGTVFIYWSVLTAGASLWTIKRVPDVTQLNFREVLSILVIGLLVAIWCRRSVGLLPILRTTGVAPIWLDYFIHGTMIAQFGKPLALGQSSFLMVDQPIVFYHYAIFMLPAAVAGLVDLPSLGLATSLLLPYGIFLAALGSYAFARTVASETIAFLTPLTLLILPDASTYGLQNGFFGFHWLLFTAPGSGYGLGVAFTALALVVRWKSHRCSACLWLGICVTIALFEFRAHIFLLFAPALAITLFWETALVQRHARTVMAGVLTLIMIGAISVLVMPAIRDAWLRFSAFDQFLKVVHTQQQPTAYDGVYQLVQQHFGQTCAWLVGLFALIPIALGALTLAWPVGMIFAVRRTGWRPLDSFPVWCLATWLGLVVLAPIAWTGNISEYQHRPFVLVYSITLIWTLLYADRLLDGSRHEGTSWHRPLLLAIALSLLVIRSALTWKSDPAEPRFEWGKQSFGRKLEPGLIDAATFVHAQAAPGDIFALIPSDRWNRKADSATQFAALADVPAYLAHASIQALDGRKRSLIVEQRVAELNQIAAMDNADEAFRKLRTIGVRFLVVLGKLGPPFDPDRSKATFQSDDATVYRIAAPGSNQ